MLILLTIFCILFGIAGTAYGIWAVYMYYKNNQDPSYNMKSMFLALGLFVLILGITFSTLANDHYSEYLEWKESYRDEHYFVPQWVEDTTYEQWCAQRGYKVNEQNRR